MQSSQLSLCEPPFNVLQVLGENNCVAGVNGRLRGRSFEGRLLLAYAEVVDRVDSDSIVDTVFLEFSKAFDVVNLFIILIKSQMLVVDCKLLLWVRDFLGCIRCVGVAGKTSELKAVVAGEKSLILIRLKRSQINEQHQSYSTAPRQGSVNRNGCQGDPSLTPFSNCKTPIN